MKKPQKQYLTVMLLVLALILAAVGGYSLYRYNVPAPLLHHKQPAIATTDNATKDSFIPNWDLPAAREDKQSTVSSSTGSGATTAPAASSDNTNKTVKKTPNAPQNNPAAPVVDDLQSLGHTLQASAKNVIQPSQKP